MISSIMAKNYAMWVSHCLIDIPVGPTAKVTNQKDAKKMAKRFKTIGNALWVKTEVTITKAEQPIWNGVWAVLQVREVLRILQQHPDRAMDLEEKALDLSAQLLVLCWVSKFYRTAYNLAKEQLVSGKAWEKMRNIIRAQNWKNPDIKSEELELWEHSFEVYANASGKVKAIDMKHLNNVARMLWAPSDSTAWVYLCKKLGDKVKEGDVLMICYAYSESKLGMTKEYLDSGLPYEIK
jgi:thymidine phosphorylase